MMTPAQKAAFLTQAQAHIDAADLLRERIQETMALVEGDGDETGADHDAEIMGGYMALDCLQVLLVRMETSERRRRA